MFDAFFPPLIHISIYLGIGRFFLTTIRLTGRWTLGLYNILFPGSSPSPEDVREYIQKAVAIGTSHRLRPVVETNINHVIPSLFYRDKTVTEWWETIRIRVSPNKIPLDDDDQRCKSDRSTSDHNSKECAATDKISNGNASSRKHHPTGTTKDE